MSYKGIQRKAPPQQSAANLPLITPPSDNNDDRNQALGRPMRNNDEPEAAGENIAYSSFRNRIAYLPERFEPPIFLLGNEFIKFSASLYKKKVSEDDIRQAAKSLELDYDVLNKRVNTYSKGMRQKLGLIATILTGCDILILDEPMSGLDPQARVCVKEKIKSLRNEGRTIFLSSHILSDLSELCDRVSVLHQQKIQFTGTPAELCSLSQTESLEQAFLQIITKNNENKAKVIN